MFTAVRRLVPIAAVAAVAAVATVALTFSDDAGADAADGTTSYGGANPEQPMYFFFDAKDTAGAMNSAEGDPGNDLEWNSSDVCDNTPQLEARMGTQDTDEQLYTCAFLINDCPAPADGMLLGITVAPGENPSKVTDDSTCWSYPAGVPIERSAPFVPLSPVTAQDPVFDITTGSGADNPSWTLDVTDPSGAASTVVRASHDTIDGSVPLHSFGLRVNGAGETRSASFPYGDWGNYSRYAEISGHDTWITTKLSDGLKMDPQICLDSGICQESSTLQYVDPDGHQLSATILSHM